MTESSEMRSVKPVLYAHWTEKEVVLQGGKGARHPEPGRYIFEGDFLTKGLVANVAVDAPWNLEETAVEAEICLMHPDYTCPDESDASSMNCKLVKRIVRAPRWTPVVVNVSDGFFAVEIWRAPLAPEDGSKAVGELVLADVAFSVIAMVTS